MIDYYIKKFHMEYKRVYNFTWNEFLHSNRFSHNLCEFLSLLVNSDSSKAWIHLISEFKVLIKTLKILGFNLKPPKLQQGAGLSNLPQFLIITWCNHNFYDSIFII